MQLLGSCNQSGDWSPDGSQIVCEVGNASGLGNLWIMNADGSSAHTIVAVFGFKAESPQWSPDGTKIAFHGRPSANIGTYAHDVYTVNPDGSQRTQLTFTADEDMYPTWSPDSTKLIFQSRHSGSQLLWIMNADGTSPTQLPTSTTTAALPMWSPDGTAVAFCAGPGGDLWIMDLDNSTPFPAGSNPHAIVSAPGEDCQAGWSPDSTQLVTVRNATGVNELWRVNKDGSNLTQITTNGAQGSWGGRPSWCCLP